MQKACEYIKKILAEAYLDYDYQIIHSIQVDKASEEMASWEDLTPILLNYLRDVDSQRGYMINDITKSTSCWDWMEWDDPDKYDEDPNQVWVEAGEGVFVYYDTAAKNAGDFPVVVVKKSFVDNLSDEVDEIISVNHPDEDFTAKLSPALYIQLYQSQYEDEEDHEFEAKAEKKTCDDHDDGFIPCA